MSHSQFKGLSRGVCQGASFGLRGTLPGCELRISGPSRRAGKRAQLRAGYAGHLTIIANQLAAAAARRPAVHAALKAHAAWQSYVVHELGPRNEARRTVFAVHSGWVLGKCMPL